MLDKHRGEKEGAKHEKDIGNGALITTTTTTLEELVVVVVLLLQQQGGKTRIISQSDRHRDDP